jgi:hypothetical protein
VEGKNKERVTKSLAASAYNRPTEELMPHYIYIARKMPRDRTQRSRQVRLAFGGRCGGWESMVSVFAFAS